jgi:biotin transport system substrate-specific component
MKLRALDAIMVSLFVALTAIGSFMTFPLYPVPITLQTFFTYLAGAILGSRLGALSQLVYVLLSCIGLPVFAGGKAGFGVLLGPTGGYLTGFIFSAFVIGGLCEAKQNPSFAWILTSMIIGTAVIYAVGAVQLSLWMRASFAETILWSIAPFLIGDSIKTLMASLVTLKIRKILPYSRMERNIRERALKLSVGQATG